MRRRAAYETLALPMIIDLQLPPLDQSALDCQHRLLTEFLRRFSWLTDALATSPEAVHAVGDRAVAVQTEVSLAELAAETERSADQIRDALASWNAGVGREFPQLLVKCLSGGEQLQISYVNRSWRRAQA